MCASMHLPLQLAAARELSPVNRRIFICFWSAPRHWHVLLLLSPSKRFVPHTDASNTATSLNTAHRERRNGSGYPHLLELKRDISASTLDSTTHMKGVAWAYPAKLDRRAHSRALLVNAPIQPLALAGKIRAVTVSHPFSPLSRAWIYRRTNHHLCMGSNGSTIPTCIA